MEVVSSQHGKRQGKPYGFWNVSGHFGILLFFSIGGEGVGYARVFVAPSSP